MRVEWGGGGKRCRPLGRRRELGSMLGEGLWWAGVPVAADWSECRGRQLPARQVVVVRGETLLPSLFSWPSRSCSPSYIAPQAAHSRRSTRSQAISTSLHPLDQPRRRVPRPRLRRPSSAPSVLEDGLARLGTARRRFKSPQRTSTLLPPSPPLEPQRSHSRSGVTADAVLPGPRRYSSTTCSRSASARAALVPASRDRPRRPPFSRPIASSLRPGSLFKQHTTTSESLAPAPGSATARLAAPPQSRVDLADSSSPSRTSVNFHSSAAQLGSPMRRTRLYLPSHELEQAEPCGRGDDALSRAPEELNLAEWLFLSRVLARAPPPAPELRFVPRVVLSLCLACTCNSIFPSSSRSESVVERSVLVARSEALRRQVGRPSSRSERPEARD